MITTLEIGNIIVPAQSLLEFDQEYTDLNGQTFKRTADGTAIVHTAWSGKVRSLVSGKGWVPSAFEDLSVGSSHVLKCAMPRSASSNTTDVTLPANRRTDSGHTPIGFALVGDLLIETLITGIAANVASLTAVSGATGYRCHYWPQITVVVTENTCKGASDANYTWRLEAEEI